MYMSTFALVAIYRNLVNVTSTDRTDYIPDVVICEDSSWLVSVDSVPVFAVVMTVSLAAVDVTFSFISTVVAIEPAPDVEFASAVRQLHIYFYISTKHV